MRADRAVRRCGGAPFVPPLIALALLQLGACASRAPVMETLGPDSYMVTVQADGKQGGYSAARAQASQEADAQCAAQRKVVLVTHLDSGISAFLDDGAVQLNFRCLVPDDPLVVSPSRSTSSP